LATWIEGRVAGRRRFLDTLHLLQVDAPQLTFVAGQFARLALPAPEGSKDPMIARPYSFVNPPSQPLHEFYFTVVAEGPLSPRLAALDVGAPIWLAPRASGLFTLDETVEADTLWCVSTGTGIGPFLSMLRTEGPWDKFANVVLVHAVRLGRDLSFREEIGGIARAHEGRFRYVPVVSREPWPDALPGRIPALIEDGRLEARAGVPLTVESAHAMLCGNPAMVDDVQKVLATRGMRRHRRKEPGHVTLETYW
jgi:ferredoxin--NADP+ reductase